MKKITIIALLALLFGVGCKKEDNPTNSDTNRPNNATPDIECNVNGKDWKLFKTDSFNMDGMPDNKQPSIVVRKNGSNLSFSIQKWDGTDTAAIAATITPSEGLTMLGNYEFNFAQDDENRHYIQYIKLDRSTGPPAQMSNSVGFFKITGHSPGAKTISGEFEAVVTNRDFRGRTTTTEIKSGKFANINYTE
jgi:hypothetical protein